MEKVILKEDFKICLVILCFYKHRLEPFINKLNNFSLGCECDTIFVHNKYEIKNISNRHSRNLEEIDWVSNTISNLDFPNKIIYERENIGEDMGAYHAVFNLFKKHYSHFFFINEAASINTHDWLRKLHNGYLFHEDVVAISPQVCLSTTHSNCLTSTFWGIKTDFCSNMVWPKPTSRRDCESQEMSLIYPQVVASNKAICQVGNGEDILSYKNKHYKQQGIYR